MGIYSLPMSENPDSLKSHFNIGGKTVLNRLAVQPMEGADGTADGAPGELTVRRYDRFAASGAGLIWFEAVAIRHEGRANPRQLWLNADNLDEYKRLVERIKETAVKESGVMPVIIMQATHSGRYSRPDKQFEPVIMYNNPLFEKDNPLPAKHIITDDEIKRLEEEYGAVTRLTASAGFDGIDIKACHRYLISESFSAFNREGLYGGSLENRMRLFKNALDNARHIADKDFIITSRMNIYDGFPYPYGFGVKEGGDTEPDLTEPLAVIKETGLQLLNITMGNPYVNQVNRPMNIEGVERMYKLTKQVKDKFPDMLIVASAPTFLKEKSPFLSAGAVEQGYADCVGFGRMAFAYPTFAKDILDGQFDRKQTCVACGNCTELMRGSYAGCAVRDPIYTKLYKELLEARAANV